MNEHDIAGKSLSELEKERGIEGTYCDLPKHYLGVPPGKRFYKKENVDFEKTRARFDQLAKRLGVISDVARLPG